MPRCLAARLSAFPASVSLASSPLLTSCLLPLARLWPICTPSTTGWQPLPAKSFRYDAIVSLWQFCGRLFATGVFVCQRKTLRNAARCSSGLQHCILVVQRCKQEEQPLSASMHSRGSVRSDALCNEGHKGAVRLRQPAQVVAVHGEAVGGPRLHEAARRQRQLLETSVRAPLADAWQVMPVAEHLRSCSSARHGSSPVKCNAAWQCDVTCYIGAAKSFRTVIQLAENSAEAQSARVSRLSTVDPP